MPGQIYQAHYEPAGELSPKSVFDISSIEDSVYSRLVALSEAGTGLMVWSGRKGLYSSRREDGGSWQAPVTISAAPSVFSAYASSFGLGVDSSGNGLLTWANDNGDKVYASSYVSGVGWAAPVLLGNRGLSRSGLPLAMNSGGKAVLLWEHWDTQPPGQWTLYASLFLPGQGWQPAQVLFTSTVYTSPAVAINEAGTIVAAWLEDVFPVQTLYATRMPAGQGWQPRVIISANNGPREPARGRQLKWQRSRYLAHRAR